MPLLRDCRWHNRRVPSPLIRILGIDPGLNRTGYGVVEANGSKLAFVAAGVIRVPAGDLHERLGTILRALAEVIRDTQPHVATVEKVFVNVNPQSTLLLGQARGAAICAAVTEGLVVHEYAALRIKQAVVGFGRADKRQVQSDGATSAVARRGTDERCGRCTGMRDLPCALNRVCCWRCG